MMHPESSSTPSPTEVVRVSDDDGLLSAIPALLGFHPTNSVVLVCLSGPRHRVGPLARVDAPTTPADTAAVVEVLAGAAGKYADQIILAVYTDRPREIDTARIAAGLAQVRPLLTVLTVGNQPRPVPVDLMAATVTAGRAVLTDRAELSRSIAYRPKLPTSGLLADMDTPDRRDQMIARMLPDTTAVARLVTAAQSTPDTDPRIGSLCAALAVVAYRHGDGALAQVAIERSQRTTPGHVLTQLLAEFIGAQLPPEALDALLTV